MGVFVFVSSGVNMQSIDCCVFSGGGGSGGGSCVGPALSLMSPSPLMFARFWDVGRGFWALGLGLGLAHAHEPARAHAAGLRR